MADAINATIAGGDNPGPSIEESYKALVEEGILDNDGTRPSALTEADEDAPKAAAKDPMAKFRKEDGSIDVDKLSKSYAELEKMKGKPKVETDDDTSEDDDTSDDDDTSENDDAPDIESERAFAAEVADEAGLDLNDLSSEWAETGTLSDESYKALEEAGYPRHAVDTYIAGLATGVAAIQNAAFEVAGGAKQYDEMIDWAMDNMSEAEIEAYDAAVSSSNKATVLQAVRGLRALYVSETSDGTQEPAEMIEGRGQRDAGGIYKHDDEVQADMNNPLYETSEAFRMKVMEKIARTEAAALRR